ncbi:hypothetical protein Rt10032_c11g4378 [Rhodotorula toruloides]|uniref:Uncharacterized protein n=1 Tax=Rhodotorula toruloides TaxID=5286 RepID=A0A511KJ06_RHOTO|nr:hypothetical protein Rt10032_c11g4378 [Rhodotorula toruloides]
MSNIALGPHLIVQSKISELRNSWILWHRFRALIKEIMTVLGIEAMGDLPLRDVPGLQSPIDSYTGKAT